MSRRFDEGAHQWLAIYCRVKNIDIDRIKGKRRHAALVAARHGAMMALRSLAYSYPAIGDALNRDHTSVIHAERKQ